MNSMDLGGRELPWQLHAPILWASFASNNAASPRAFYLKDASRFTAP
jgi:hypothetical protein